ncbi:hypothetical protein BV898_16512 [Hypsibius exemplaris]|uniref:RETREG1-3/ARL6IP-like N-terminal reticulon-homology domain-containing protein n=1 Tax=Hypsibius exemplaris TaxID=2072580 RepID=A0A9X6NG03_HYPEX|nr:hypothetical protein BV898_16512 [Hypsibius exemplaris]
MAGRADSATKKFEQIQKRMIVKNECPSDTAQQIEKLNSKMQRTTGFPDELPTTMATNGSELADQLTAAVFEHHPINSPERDDRSHSPSEEGKSASSSKFSREPPRRSQSPSIESSNAADLLEWEPELSGGIEGAAKDGGEWGKECAGKEDADLGTLQARDYSGTVVRDDASGNLGSSDGSAAARNGLEELGGGARRSKKRPSVMDSDKGHPPPAYEVFHTDNTFSEVPSYNDRRSILPDESIFDQATLPLTDPSMIETFQLSETMNGKMFLEPSTAQELQDLKVQMSDWRVILVLLRDVVMWEKSWNPLALVFGCTFLFAVVAWLDFSFLSSFAMIGALVTATDLLVPILAPVAFSNTEWSPADEKKLDELCKTLLKLKKNLRTYSNLGSSFRRQMPRTTSIIMSIVFLIGAWVFSRMNNTILLYMLTMCVLLTPGLKKSGVWDKMADLAGRVKTHLTTSRTALADPPKKAH